MRGMSIRLAMLQTHYRKPKDFKHSELNQCAKTIRKWLSLIDLSQRETTPPLSVLEALCDDLNTSFAITEMHKIAARGAGDELFAAMIFLGLIPGQGSSLDYGAAIEIKTIPIDHIPLVQWPTVGAA